MGQNYTKGFDIDIKMFLKKLYKGMWKNHKNGFDKTIQIDMIRLHN